MGEKEVLKQLNVYTSLLSNKRHLLNNESLTSHVLLSYLFLRYNIKPYQIVPQGKNKTGPVDYMYFPANKKYKNVNVYLEVKAYGRIRQGTALKQIKKYMKGALPKEAKSLSRANDWAIGIYTDMKMLNIIFRKITLKMKTDYFIAVKDINSSSVDGFFKNEDLKTIFSTSFNPIQYLSQKLWEDQNRLKFVRKILDLDKKAIYNKIQKVWLQKLGENAPNANKKTFSKAINLAFETNAKKNLRLLSINEYQEHTRSIKSITNQKKIRKEIINVVNSYGFYVKISKKIFYKL